MTSHIDERRSGLPAVAERPYSSAVVHGGLVYVSGQLPVDQSSGQLLAGTVQDQTRKTLENLGGVLKAAGSDLASMLKVTVLLRSRSDWAAMNSVYCEMVPAPRPARTAIIVKELADGAHVEFDCIAVIRGA